MIFIALGLVMWVLYKLYFTLVHNNDLHPPKVYCVHLVSGFALHTFMNSSSILFLIKPPASKFL